VALVKTQASIGLPSGSAERVRVRLEQVESWSQWLTGVEVVEELSRSPTQAEIVLMVDGPRLFRMSLAVEFRENGLEYGLLEGPFSVLKGSVVVDETGDVIVWEMELRGLTYVSNALKRELADSVLPTWLSALVVEGQ
jgi:hypothetical protein